MPAPQSWLSPGEKTQTNEADQLQHLRAQLLDIRARVVDELLRKFYAGHMAVLASVTGALAGVEAEIAARG